MINNSGNLMIFLLAMTVLGAVMGYCLAVIRSKKRVASLVAGMQASLEERKKSVATELQSTQKDLHKMQEKLEQTSDRANAALQREEALEVHAQLQAQRLKTLEAQVSSYEDQQIRLQRDFASYKSNKSRELELARTEPDSWSEADQLPVLNKRIDEPEDSGKASSGRQAAEARKTSDKDRARPERTGLSTPLSRELDIPALSESELPDSVDELEFELVDLDGTGEWPSG